MKVYTKKGDDGTTGLIGGTRVPKHHLRIEAYGTVDELTAVLGMLAGQKGMEDFVDQIQKIQSLLFTIGSHLANDAERSKFKLPELPSDAVMELEQSMDRMAKSLEPLKNFVLPGGCAANAAAHLGRTVCRRAERKVSALSEVLEVDPFIIQYLNRLSDYLFVLARYASKVNDVEEIKWRA